MDEAGLLRAHLFSDDEPPARLTLLAAPAGWGKTTVARRLGRRWERVAYCDAYGVEDAAELATQLLTALLAIATRENEGRFRQGLAAPRAQRRESAQKAWRNDVASPSVTIFDNLEQIADKPDVIQFLDALLDRPHPARSAILCSRVPLRVRTSRFAAPHETRRITEADLQLREDDLRHVFPSARPAEIERIEDATRGWAIAVFYLTSVAKSGSLTGALDELAARGTESLHTYLIDEVLGRVSARQRDALIACAAIGDCTPADLAHVLDITLPEAEALLRELPFVRHVPTDAYFEVHPLIRTLALTRERIDADRFLERAARAVLAGGDSVRAAELFARCGKMRDAAAAIADTAGYILSAPDPRLARVLGMLDRDTLMAFPNLWSASVYSRTFTLGVPVRLEEGRQLWKDLDDGADLAIRIGILTTYLDSCGVSGLLEEAEATLQRFARSLRDEEHVLGDLVVALWNSIFAVWRSDPIDLVEAMKPLQTFFNIDATDALYQHTVVAHYYGERGDRVSEAAAHARAIEAGMRCGLPLVQVFVWAQYAFYHWFWGDDAGFAEAIARLEAVTVPSVYEGVRFFLACARGVAHEPIGFENHKLRVNGYLIAASVASKDDARSLARAAIETADTLQYPFQRVLARVAAAALEDGERREMLAQEALEIAQRTQSQPLKSAVEAFVQRRSDLGMLAAFVQRYVSSAPNLEVRLLSLHVLRNEHVLALSGRSLEIVAALALYRGGLSRERVADFIWPNLSTIGGQSALRVAITRLRRALGPEAVLSTAGGYALAPWVRVDLDDIERTLTTVRLRGLLEPEQRAMLERTAGADLEDLSSKTRAWSWFAPSLARLEATAREATIILARNALLEGRFSRARLLAHRLIDRDELDIVAHDILLAAQREHAP